MRGGGVDSLRLDLTSIRRIKDAPKISCIKRIEQAMDHAFWHQKWEENNIPFHEGRVNAQLLKNFHRLSLNRGDRVFVPLCGKTTDLDWLVAQGCHVVGIELNQSAVEEVFARMGAQPEISTSGDHRHYKSETIELFVGDVFGLSADMLGPVDAVYDRAALVALPAPMRASYAEHLTAVTQAAPQLLITFEYEQAQMKGPPFSVTGAEIRKLYGDRYRPERVSSVAITGSLAERCSGTENAWLLEPI